MSRIKMNFDVDKYYLNVDHTLFLTFVRMNICLQLDYSKITKDNIWFQDQTMNIKNEDCVELVKKNFGVIFH